MGSELLTQFQSFVCLHCMLRLKDLTSQYFNIGVNLLDCFPQIFMFGYILFHKSIRNWVTGFGAVFVIQENDGNLQIFKQTFMLFFLFFF